ncbi:F-box/LRR-repeat protein 6-like protein [Dinothrombium tinctorium]|uniref:F-box/LRR-repeat protein 6-like protein n=1 Tax=Dinothrombium tinctorium TaxID=1965070 RepID=A0A443QI48_9ACAR|nr:F-box/LRR-repeat protein 6-like protein [Dinothrombium tinctorium]
MEDGVKRNAAKGAFGVRKKRMLFSFSGELWSDEDSSDLEFRLSNEAESDSDRYFGEAKMDAQRAVASTSLPETVPVVDESVTRGERITLTLTKKRKRGRKANGDCGKSDYFVSKNSENKKRKMKVKYKRREPWEDMDTKILKREAVVNEMLGGNKHSLDLKPFLRPNPNEISHFLPNNVLSKVFEFVVEFDKRRAVHNLLSLCQVSETFRQLIISNSNLWKYIDLSEFSRSSIALDFVALCESSTLNKLEKLSIAGWTPSEAEIVLSAIIEYCSKTLKELVLRECRGIHAEKLQLIAEKCSALENIDLSRMSYSDFNAKPQAKYSKNLIETLSLKTFLSTCGLRLKQINLAENKINSFGSLTSVIMSHCPNLTLLDLSNIETLSTPLIDIDKLQTSCPLLEILRLANVTLKTSHLASHSFSYLEELSIPVQGETSGHSDAVIYALTKSAENLKLLDIRGSKFISPSCLVKIPAWNLQHLSISNCQRLCDPQLELILRKWRHSLIELDISLNNNEEAVNSSLGTICSEDNSPLKIVNLRGSAVSLSTLKKLFLCCKKLEFIDLQSCRSLPRGIKRAFFGNDLLKFKKDVLDGFYGVE